MPHEPTSAPAQFIQGAPVLTVQDVRATATYYRDVLGFTWDFGDDQYSIVWRDNSAIHFTRGAENSSGVSLFQWVKDTDAMYQEVTATGATVTVDIGDRDYGVRDFRISDPNGLDVVFGSDID